MTTQPILGANEHHQQDVGGYFSLIFGQQDEGLIHHSCYDIHSFVHPPEPPSYMNIFDQYHLTSLVLVSIYRKAAGGLCLCKCILPYTSHVSKTQVPVYLKFIVFYEFTNFPMGNVLFLTYLMFTFSLMVSR